MKKKSTNVLNSLLNALNVKHTNAFSNKYFNEHPYKYNLFGISKMLSDYEISNVGTKIENKLNNILDIETPFIAHVGGDFAVVYDVTEKDVEYRTGSLNITVPRKNFCEAWSGVVLLVETNSNSIEPDYEKNHRIELFQRGLKSTLVFATAMLLIIAFTNNGGFYSPGLLLSFAINLVGAYIGFLLVQKQLNIQSSYSDKICSFFKQADCNNILESNAAKLWNVFGWSEIGFSYFSSNLIVIAFLPHLINYYAIINICVLPYTIWSIWYQGFKAKQWCVLCLIVQIVLGCIFITNLVFQYIHILDFGLTDMIMLISIYLISFITITLLIPYLSEQSKIENVTQEINSLKLHEGIIEILLKKQTYYQCDKSNSKIIFGNPDAGILITILTNPHCNPCAKMHARIEKLLESGVQNICIQYIFSSFDQSLDISNKFLITAYLYSTETERSTIYNQWFNEGNFNKEKFFERFSFDLAEDELDNEFEKHQKWKLDTKLEATPTVLINGYKLPRNYQIEDFRFISELKM